MCLQIDYVDLFSFMNAFIPNNTFRIYLIPYTTAGGLYEY